MRFLGLSSDKLFTTAAVLALLFVVNASIQAATTLVATPASINFGLQTIGGKSAPARLAMTNDALSSITIDSIAVTNSQFSYSGPSLPATLKPGQTWSGTVSFTPSAAGRLTGSIVFRVENRGAQAAGLSGTGVSPATPARSPSTSNAAPAPSVPPVSKPVTATPVTAPAVTTTAIAPGQISVNPTGISFGNENVGTSVTRTISVTNSGGSNVTISNVIVAGAGLAANGVSSGLILAPAQAAALNVSFDPATAMSVAGSIAVVSNASNSPTSISVAGTGVAAPAPTSLLLAWNPSTSTVVGYNVYASFISGGPYTRLTSSPVATTSYSDTVIQAGETYYFVATAVNSSSIESAYSNEISATIP